MLAQLLKKGAPRYKGMPEDLPGKVEYALEMWKDIIEPHIELEEAKLFPEIIRKASSLTDLTNELNQEHLHLSRCFQNLTVDEMEMDKLGRLIEKHVRKEERVLFQKIQEAFSDQEMEELRILLSKD
jgi:hemerythrin-like domain-containing protein